VDDGLAHSFREHSTLRPGRATALSFGTAQQDELRSANERFAALVDLNRQLASVRDAQRLFDRVCSGARRLIGARFGVLVAADRLSTTQVLSARSGLGSRLKDVVPPQIDAGLLGTVVRQSRAIRVRNGQASALEIGLPACYPEAHSIIAAPIRSLTRTYGWICLADKLGAHEFDAEDERLLAILGAQLGRIYENNGLSEQLDYLAHHDTLTGLANRALFKDRLEQLISVARRESAGLAVIIAEPQRLASLNETLGRAATDQLLQELANRLVRSIGSQDRVGCLGPDQFAAVLTGLRPRADVRRAAEELWSDWLGAPFDLQEPAIRVTARAGVAIFPIDADDGEALLRNAETALETAKTSGKALVAYTERLSEHRTARVTLERNLRDALERGEFVLHYQPKVELKSRRLQGLEALIRWNNPELGLVPPDRFIPMMEENGLIVDVGTWVLRQASSDRARWLEQQLNPPRIAVNVSTAQLRCDDFVRTVTDIVDAAGPDCGLDIEVTESLLMADVADNLAKLAAVRTRGVNIALDDFGTGYSSLSYLARLPVHALKIDRSFIADLHDDPCAMTLVSTIISLARALRLETIAEGVQSEEQAKILRLLQCDQMQGDLICKPLPAAEMSVYLHRLLQRCMSPSSQPRCDL